MFLLAQTCSSYFGGALYNSDERHMAYFEVFSDVEWECCVRLAKYPGEDVHKYLLSLKNEPADIPDYDFERLITVQSALPRKTSGVPCVKPQSVILFLVH